MIACITPGSLTNSYYLMQARWICHKQTQTSRSCWECRSASISLDSQALCTQIWNSFCMLYSIDITACLFFNEHNFPAIVWTQTGRIVSPLARKSLAEKNHNQWCAFLSGLLGGLRISQIVANDKQWLYLHSQIFRGLLALREKLKIFLKMSIHATTQQTHFWPTSIRLQNLLYFRYT